MLVLKEFLLSGIMFVSTLAMGEDPPQFAEGSGATQEALASSSSPNTPVPAATPKVSASYSYYKYNLKGESTANTNIYRFGEGTVDLHLFSVNWNFSPEWTFIVMVPYLKNMVQTIYEPVAGGLNLKLTDHTEGLSDLRLMAMKLHSASTNHVLLWDVSATAPTGSTDEHFSSSPAQRASYNMQLGSGTPDLIGGVTHSYFQGNWLTTARGQLVIRGGRNSHGWALGDEFTAKLEGHYQVHPFFSAGLQGNFKARGAVRGRDGKYEIFNSYTGTVGGVGGDGHQYYHSTQSVWDVAAVAKVSSPTWNGISANLQAGLPFWQGAMNKDDIRLDVKSWFAATVSGSF